MNRFFAATAMAIALSAPAVAQTTIFQLDDIIFSAGYTALDADRIGVSVDVLTEDEILSAGEVQLADLLATLPGVSVTRNGPPGTTTNVRIRGADDSFISVYVDGILVNDPTATSGQFSGFGDLTTGSIQRVEILRGSQSSIYGASAVAGVISISTVATGDEPVGTTQTLGVEAGSFGAISASYGYTQRTGPLTLGFALSHAQADGFSAAEENVGNAEADPFEASRLSFGAIYEVSDTVIVGFNGFREVGRFEFDEFAAAPVDGTPGDETGFRNANGIRVFAELQTGSWMHDLTATYLETDRGSSSTTVGPATAAAFGTPFSSTFNGERLTFSQVSTTEAIQDTRLSVGTDWREDTAIYANAPGGQTSMTTRGLFFETLWSPNDTIDVSLSLRHEDNSTFGGQTTGRIAFAFNPSAALTFRGALATGYRPPSLDELFGSYLTGAFPFQGNPNLIPEESESVELGVTYTANNGASVTATVFRLDVRNFIAFAFGIPVSSLMNVPGTTRFQGVELSGSFPIGQAVNLTGAYTYTDARQADNTRVTRVPRHDLAVGLDAELGGGWGANATLRTVADVMDNSATVGDDFTTLGASFSYAFNDATEAYIRIENLLDEEYQTVRGYGTSDRAVYVGLRSRF